MTEAVKVSVVYYSAFGTVAEMARTLADEAEKAGAEVRLRRIPEREPDTAVDANPAWRANVDATRDIAEATAEDVRWADAVLFGTPTRFGTPAGEFKMFLDGLGGLWQKGLLKDKVYSGFMASSTLHGGQEGTLHALYTCVHHWGGIVVSPGYTDPSKFVDGNPYGTSHVTAKGTRPVDDVTRTAAAVQAKRVVRIAGALRDGLAAHTPA